MTRLFLALLLTLLTLSVLSPGGGSARQACGVEFYIHGTGTATAFDINPAQTSAGMKAVDDVKAKRAVYPCPEGCLFAAEVEAPRPTGVICTSNNGDPPYTCTATARGKYKCQ